jgi:ankyrin repeat protein
VTGSDLEKLDFRMRPNQIWNEYTPLMIYSANGKIALVERLCADPTTNIDEQKGWNKVTALMLAAQNNHVQVVRYLHEKGADINLCNSMKNTALMLAAEAGHDEAVKLLIECGANIGLHNQYGHTALIIAAGKGHLEVVKLIVQKDPAQVKVRNNYYKNCLIMAAEFGEVHIVRWLTEEFGDIDINIETNRGVTPLMFASGCGTDSCVEIVKILIAKGAEVNKESVEGDTAMLWAAIGGNAEIVRILHMGGAHVNQTNHRGLTALMKAAERGHYRAAKALIDARADMWRFVSYGNEQRMDAMKLAWLTGHVELATNLFMIPTRKDKIPLLSRNVTDIFNKDELEELAQKYANPAQVKALSALVVYSCFYDFHFDLFIKLIPRFKTPNTVLNKQMVVMFSTLYKQSSAYDIDLVYKLVQLAAACGDAASNHPLEKISLQDHISTIMGMLTECMNSDCMDDARNVQRMLCSAVSKREDTVFVDELVEQAQAFLRGPLETCIRAKVTGLFKTGHVSTYVDNIFWGFLRTKHGRSVPQFWFTPQVFLPPVREFSKECENIRMYKSLFVQFRFSPAAMFFGEGLSKYALLILVVYSSVQTRAQGANDSGNVGYMSLSEWALLIMTVSMVIYEWGQLCGTTVALFPRFKDIGRYIRDIWNILDMSGLILVSAYFLLKHIFSQIDAALATLAVSTIFFSVSNIRYLSIIEPVGKLIIMVFAMMGRLRSFAFLFGVFVFGFCVTLYCLLGDVTAYQTLRNTLLTLFSMSVQNYDPTFDGLTDNEFGVLAIIVQVCYILLTSVVLMNLVIARMSAIHDKIDDKSFEEWQYSRALTVHQFVVVEERSPFCMLPPPFNILPCLVFPLHAWLLSSAAGRSAREQSLEASFDNKVDPNAHTSALHTQQPGSKDTHTHLSSDEGHNNQDASAHEPLHHIHHSPVVPSLAGTMCDVQMSIIMSFFAPFIEYLVYQYRMIIKIIIMLNAGKVDYLLRGGIFREYLLVTLTFPLWVIPFIVSLLLQTIFYSQKTLVAICKIDDHIKYIVQYEKGKRYKDPELLPSDMDRITIKVLRIEDLLNCDDSSNPIIKFRIGDVEKTTGPSIFGGKRPAWSKEEVLFPLRAIDLCRPILSYEVVDKDYRTGSEIHIAECQKPFDIRRLMGNRSYEGVLGLRKGCGKIVVVIKVNFPSFLAMHPPANASNFGVFLRDEPMSPLSNFDGVRSPSVNTFMSPKSPAIADATNNGTNNGNNIAVGMKTLSNSARTNTTTADMEVAPVITGIHRPKHLSVQLFSEPDKRRIFGFALRHRQEYLAAMTAAGTAYNGDDPLKLNLETVRRRCSIVSMDDTKRFLPHSQPAVHVPTLSRVQSFQSQVDDMAYLCQVNCYMLVSFCVTDSWFNKGKQGYVDRCGAHDSYGEH